MTNLGGTGVSENTDFDDEITALFDRQDRLNPATLAIWQNDTSAQAGDVVTTKERSTGNGGGATGDVISGTGTANGADIVANTANTLSWVLRIKDRLDLLQFGSIPGTLSTVAIQVAFALQATKKLPIYIPENALPHLVDGQLEYHGYGIQGDGRFTSQLKSTFVGVILKKINSNDEGRLKDFSLFGDGPGVAGVIGMAADGSGAGWFRTQIKNVDFREMEQVAEIEFGLFCIFDTWLCRNVKRGHFYVGGGAGWNNTWFNNGITYINCLWDEASEYAIDYVGTGLAFAGSNTMQSGGDGIRIDRDDAGRTNINTLDNLYFEFNLGHDIKLKDTFVTMGPVMFQSGPSGTPLFNILADNSDIYATGRPSYLDVPDRRISLINGSKYVAMYDEIVSSKIINDATSEYVYIPTRLEDKRLEQIFTDLDTTPVQLAAPIGTSTRYTNHLIEWVIEAPNGEYTMFTTYGELLSGTFRTSDVSGAAVKVNNNEFTLTIGGLMYTFLTSSGNGSMTIEADATATGDTILTTRVVNSRSSTPLY